MKSHGFREWLLGRSNFAGENFLDKKKKEKGNNKDSNPGSEFFRERPTLFRAIATSIFALTNVTDITD